MKKKGAWRNRHKNLIEIFDNILNIIYNYKKKLENNKTDTNNKVPTTYARAGVNIKSEEIAVNSIVSWAKKTFKFREGKTGEVMRDIGTFANLIDMGDFALAMCTDGAGTKVLVAQELKTYNTIGIDMIAMNVNDLICVGAEPIALVDYLAMEAIDAQIVKEIALGIYEGAKQSGIAVIGGETATLGDVIKGIDNRGFDIAGTAIGVVNKDKIITGENILPGDFVIGLKSSGIHSNGLTLARKVLPKAMYPEILKPTKIYVNEILNLLNNYGNKIHGLAHITGGGFLNLTRLCNYGFIIDNPQKPQMVFNQIQKFSGNSDREMYRTFNMGTGFCVICSQEIAGEIEKNEDCEMQIIGRVVEEKGVRIVKDGEEIKL